MKQGVDNEAVGEDCETLHDFEYPGGRFELCRVSIKLEEGKSTQ